MILIKIGSVTKKFLLKNCDVAAISTVMQFLWPAVLR